MLHKGTRSCQVDKQRIKVELWLETYVLGDSCLRELEVLFSCALALK
jgi:hypothetical protein